MSFQEFLQNLGFNQKEQEKLLKQPIYHGEERLQRVVKALINELELDKKGLRELIYANPLILNYTPELLKSKISDYARVRNTTEDAARNMFRDYSQIISYDVDKTVVDKIQKS